MDPVERIVKDPGYLVMLVIVLLAVALMWRKGYTAAKWFLILLLVGTFLSRWDNTLYPWFVGREREA